MLDFRYRITVETEDVAVLYCLRGLAHLCQKRGTVNTAWGGTGEKDWRSANNRVTFKFTEAAFRERFVREATRLLAPPMWSEISRAD